jgi:hypothetical protein
VLQLEFCRRLVSWTLRLVWATLEALLVGVLFSLVWGPRVHTVTQSPQAWTVEPSIHARRRLC